MKFVKQSVEEIKQNTFDLTSILKHIERCARVTYKSENNITDTSYDKFVSNLIKSHHDRPLEMGTVHMRMSAFMYDTFLNKLLNCEMLNQIWIKAVEEPIYGDDMLITTNYRYYLGIMKKFPEYTRFFVTEESDDYPQRHTIKFVTDRAIVDEFRTHVTLSHLCESTRWCGYQKDRFGNELTFIDFEDSLGEMEALYPTFKYTEQEYMLNTQNGYQPQQARRGLPFGIKAELISCGFEDAWENFVYRRSDKHAHPMAQELSNQIKKLDWFKKL